MAGIGGLDDLSPAQGVVARAARRCVAAAVKYVKVTGEMRISRHSDGDAIAQAKAEITSHVADGTVPGDVESFGDLHDYVDANGHGGCFDLYSSFSNDGATRIANEVQCELDDWIKAGALRAGR